MAEIVNTTYNDDSIQTLEWNEHIRRRAGMYIGRLGNGDRQGDGIYVLLKEIVDNSIDEFSMGFGKRIDITIEDKTVSVRDFGRGIPLNKVVDATSKLNTGGKFDDTNFKKSVGMNGVGTKAVNAMSVDFYVASYREGQCSYARFSRGILLESAIVPSNEKNGTFIRFTPDEEMFNDFSFHMEYVESMVKNYSYLKKGLTLNLNGVAYKSENGLLDLVNENMSETPLYPLIHLEGEDIEIVLTHGNSYGENIATFVNGQNTRDGGTHLAAYREAIAKTFKDFFKKDYKPEDIRQGIVGAISIQIQEPIFEGQTKTKLGSTYMWEKQVKGADGTSSVDRGPTIRTYVNDFVTKNLNDYLHMHMDIVPTIEDKIKASQAEREEIAGVQKKSRERAKKTAVYNRKLRDCRYHFSDNKFPKGMEDLREKTSIFITEGDSASGTITKVRDANTQAVFSLRGKPINCFKESRKRVAENEELNLLINALGVEEDLEDLRYNNIIVATDADDDGMHIRMLVLTFIMKYYPELIRRGHVYILQTPLFRVRNKQKTTYCYTDDERVAAIKATPGAEITRFKGLGEISPEEFKNFIGKDMRLDPVLLHKEFDTDRTLTFYMGENTLERREFIMQNLRVEDDESIVVA